MVDLLDTTPSTGHGTTVAFAGTEFTAQFTSIGGGDISRESIETTHLAQTNAHKTFIPSDLIDPGEREFEFYYEPNNIPHMTNHQETITITFPDGAVEASAGFFTSFSRPTMVSEDLITATATIKLTGAITYTPTPEVHS